MAPLNEIKCFLLDMDGTIYLGDKLISGADLFLKTLKENDKRYIFITNNSSKNRMAYVDKLSNLGIRAEPDEVFTSGEATTIYLKKIKQGATVYLLGTGYLKDEFMQAGFKLAKEGDNPDFVVLGFDTSLTYNKLWAACDYIRKGIPYYATHPDLNCPLEGGKYMPDTGAMIAFIKAATGKSPIVVGKPNKPIIEAILNKYSLNKNEIAIVGDRLTTDIKMGNLLGVTSVLVLSGETNKKKCLRSRIKSDYVFDSVKEIIPYIQSK